MLVLGITMGCGSSSSSEWPAGLKGEWDGSVLLVETPPQGARAVSSAELRRVMSELNDRPASEQLRVLREAAEGEWFESVQVAQVIERIADSKKRIDAIEILADRILDLDNAAPLVNMMDYSGEQRRVKKILSRASDRREAARRASADAAA